MNVDDPDTRVRYPFGVRFVSSTLFPLCLLLDGRLGHAPPRRNRSYFS